MVRVISLLLLLAGMLLPVPGRAEEGRWETLEATMVVLKDDVQPPAANTNRIVLPLKLEARLRERMEQRKSGPVVDPVPVSMGRNGR